jgi:hypothetical protein
MKGNLDLELIGKKNIMSNFIWDVSEISCSDPLDKGTWETIQNPDDGIVTIKVKYCSGNPDNKTYCESQGFELYLAQYGI